MCSLHNMLPRRAYCVPSLQNMLPESILCTLYRQYAIPVYYVTGRPRVHNILHLIFFSPFRYVCLFSIFPFAGSIRSSVYLSNCGHKSLKEFDISRLLSFELLKKWSKYFDDCTFCLSGERSLPFGLVV